MFISENDKSNYINGFLILIRDEGIQTETNKLFVKTLANLLEYNHYFVEHALNEVCKKESIPEPPVFSSRLFAKIFIKDGIRMVFKNNIINLNAVRWLLEVTDKNNLSKVWFYLELENFLDNYNPDANSSFEIQKYVNRVYS